jgi:serine/threonine protein kinase
MQSVNGGPSGSSRERKLTFARKEYKNKEVIDFLKERTNLELIDRLKHPHLIHIMQTYQLGERFNILFPYAKSNLQDYLRNGQAPRDRHIFNNPLWEQVLGITEALSKIINFKDPEDTAGHKGLKGYHLDLKPQNVLVFVERAPGRPSKDVLKISDFGQSEFVDVGPGHSSTTSRLIRAGGTGAYAPPEYYGMGATGVYDVWSLGIIVLEILAFAIRGIDGLTHRTTGLDNVRHTIGSQYYNSRFYTGQGQTAKIKPEILTWLNELIEDQVLQESEREQFVRPLVKLGLEMLEPDYVNRKSIDKVLSKMWEIFKTGISESSEETAMSLKKSDEEILVDLK